MNQFFFGSAEQPLYGVHHPPVSGTSRSSAVLICYPLWREYMRCHRAFVRLCNQLAQAGYHAMRFDYYGTGDSAGDGSDVDVDTWVSNIHAAAQELRDVSGISRISMVGVRFGAALAAYAAARERPVDLLLMWDPVTDGKQYIERMSSLHEEFTTDLSRFPKCAPDESNNVGGELIGMPFPETLRRSIENLSIESIASLNVERVAILATEDRDEYRRSQEHLSSLAAHSNYQVIDEPTAWEVLSDLGAVMMPHELLQKIVAVTNGEMS